MHKAANKTAGKAGREREKKPSRPKLANGHLGPLFSNAAEEAADWHTFAKNKFAATEREAQRDEVHHLGPPEGRAHDVLTDKDLDTSLKALVNSKATGGDKVPCSTSTGTQK